MLALGLGLVAAVAWAVHDICVRYVSQRSGILPAFLTVLIVGSIAVFIALILSGNSLIVEGRTLRFSVLSGITFALAGCAHYMAFSIGPVRLVAPIIGAYPVLSVAWAVFSGTPITALQWLAVLGVVAGVGYVAAKSDETETQSNHRAAILWSFAAGSGFALTFAMAHIATENGDELPIIMVTRLVATVTVAAIALGTRQEWRPNRAQLPLLAVMGILDALALAVVMWAGSLANPEFAAVGASTFGLLTVILAWAFLSERMTQTQWIAVVIVFTAIGVLAI